MFIGLDLGTSGLKALLCDETQAVRAVARVGYPMDTRSLGLVEQDCADWIRAVETAMAELRAADPSGMAAVRAIGLSGQMHTLVVLGADDAPLRPAMIWNDVRGADFVRRAPEVLPDLAAITGVGPMTSFTAAKLDWLARLRAAGERSTAELLSELRKAYPDSPLSLRVAALAALNRR